MSEPDDDWLIKTKYHCVKVTKYGVFSGPYFHTVYLYQTSFLFFLFWDTETISVSIFIHLFMIKFMLWRIIYKYQNVFYSFHFGREVCLIWGGNIWRTGVREDSDKREGGVQKCFFKMQILRKFSSINLLMLIESVLEMPYCEKNFGKSKIEISPFLGELELNFHIWPRWFKIRKICISSFFLTF